MTLIRETAPAKINLYLHVGPVREDGLHELASLFVFTNEGDEIIVEPADDLSLAIEGPFAPALIDFPVTDNLVYRAAESLRAHQGVAKGARLRLIKKLPVAAGVGGGSADAAAALRALARLWDVAVSEADLRALAFALGADVPACLDRRPILVDGAGERLSPGPALPALHVLLVNTGALMPTGPVFQRFDKDHPAPPRPVHPATSERSAVGMRAMMEKSRNDLQGPACAVAPEIADLLTLMSDLPGALGARMSGSGATCFALFTDEEPARAGAVQFSEKNYWTMVSRLASG